VEGPVKNTFLCMDYLLENFKGKYDGEEQFVLLKQRATDVAIETVREMVGQIAQSSVKNL